MSGNKKMTVAFSPTEDMWSSESFRELVKSISRDVDGSVIYIITTNQDVDFINKVATEALVDVNNIFIVPDNTSLISKLTELSVLIFMSDNQFLNNQIESSIGILLNKNNVTGCVPIIINNILDQYRSQLKYYTWLDFWTVQIKKSW